MRSVAGKAQLGKPSYAGVDVSSTKVAAVKIQVGMDAIIDDLEVIPKIADVCTPQKGP